MASEKPPEGPAVPAPPMRRIRVNDHAVEHVIAARPIHRSMLSLLGVLGLGVLILGAFAIYRGAISDTSIDFLGAHIKTTSVGVALVAVAGIVLFLVCRSILKNMVKLAALPPDKGR